MYICRTSQSARMRKPLPLGEVSPQVTERASHRGKNLCAAISCVFVRARLSLRLPFFVSVLALSGASRQLSQRESLCNTKSGAHRWSSLCVPHFVLFCTERRTRALRAARRESGANHKPLSLSLGEWNGGTESPQRELQASLCSESEELWLGLTNLAVTTGYHSLS